MASACINNIGVSPKYSSYAWLSPRISFSREDSNPNSKLKSSDLTDSADFEFRLHDCPEAMLPADELFSDGKLIPLHMSVNVSVNPSTTNKPLLPEIKAEKCISRTDPYLFSPKAPRCASRWREILGLKKQNQNHCESSSTNSKSLKLLLNRSLKSSSSSTTTPLDTSSLSLPLLKDSDSESVSISSSRLSLSSSSSGHDHEDLPRLSLDFEKPTNPNPFIRNPNPNQNPNQHRMRQINTNSTTTTTTSSTNPGRVGRNPIKKQSTGTESATVVNGRGASVDSPRMNSSGKVVFQSLERSSSSPSSFNGGPRFKHRGMERSYSANVRVTPVLNVPVSSLRGASKPGSVFGFSQLFSSSSSSPQQRDGNGGRSKTHRSNRTRVTDRN